MLPRPTYHELRHGTRYLHQGPLGTIGATRCDRDHRDFRAPGPIEAHVFVFPTLPVQVERDREAPFLADANTMTFHHEGDEIRRAADHRRGDHCNWFALRYDVLVPALEERCGHRARFGGPFPVRHARADRRAFLDQALLVDGLLDEERVPDPLEVEESLLRIFERVLASLPGEDPDEAPDGATLRKHRRLVEQAKAWFAAHFARPAALGEVAAAVGASPFHLARLFRRHTGRSLHEYRHQLRLRAVVAAVLEGETRLTDLALRVGFSSHSHMTDAFRRAFGLTPSALREPGRRVRLP